jgi:hypothetical protein
MSSNTSKEIASLRDAALDDLMVTSDAELIQETVEDGCDAEAIAAEMKASMREAAAASLRQRMQRTQVKVHAVIVTIQKNRPALDQIKQIVQDLFGRDKSLGLAFRDGKRQTDSDWQSLYDDLLAMGAIKPSDDDV